MPDQHALLSASSAARWLNCTAAPRTEEKLPETTSEYAEEGRLAHALAELKLRKEFTPMGAREYNKLAKPIKADSLYQPEMDKHTDLYRDRIKETAMAFKTTPFVTTEVRVDYSDFAPEGFGTSDCVLICGNTLHVIDFKYGKGVPVEAKNNPQMMLYALGAIKTYLPIYGKSLTDIVMTIIQPRLDNVASYITDRDSLIDWGNEYVRPRAQIAYDGKGTFVPGDWCRFCRARGCCKARAEHYTGLQDIAQNDPAFLADTELGRVLQQAVGLKKWASALEDYALKTILAGRTVPGWKAVEGRSNRKFSDLDKAFEVLRGNGYNDAILYERKPLTLTALEKAIGKKDLYGLCEQYIIKPQGAPTLAPESDARPAFHSAEADFKEAATQ